ncbi:HNH endonuclease [Pseudomonas sp. WP001]|nr:HNH endonuclease [Pseudomonas sp. WP001]
MSRLTSIKPRMSAAESRPFALPAAPENVDGWGSGRGGRPWRRIRAAILIRDNYTCQACGVVTQQLEVDHILNRARGGTDDDANLQALCVPCHKLKTASESAEGLGKAR